MKKILIGFFLLIIIGVSSIIIAPRTILKAKDVHYHAGFIVYKNNKLVDFSAQKYMNASPCTINGKNIEDSHEDEQLEKAHLHDQIGDVLHVHRENAKWKDLFINIKYPIESSATAYIGGKKVVNFLNQEIEPYQSIVIFEGKHVNDQKYLKNAVTKKSIEVIEKKSESCSS